MSRILVYCTDCEFFKPYYYTRMGIPFSNMACRHEACFKEVDFPSGRTTVRINNYLNLNKNNDCPHYKRHVSFWEKVKLAFRGEHYE